MTYTRRVFCSQALTTLLARPLFSAQSPLHPAPPTSRPDVAAIERVRVLSAAQPLLSLTPRTITSFPPPHSPGDTHDFYSEPDDYFPDPASPNAAYVHRPGESNPNVFTAHRDALLSFCVAVPTLVAAYVLTSRQPEPDKAAARNGEHPERYAEQAVAHLRAWFITPATRMNPNLLYGEVIPNTTESRPEGITSAAPLAEVARALPFLFHSEALNAEDRSAILAWFGAYLVWLSTSRLAGLTRDLKNHHGSSWLLQATAIAHLEPVKGNPDVVTVASLRHLYRNTTLRAQIAADGSFPHELSTPFPYRNSLFNLDLLAGVCELLSTPFDSAWDYELQDGPSMRVAIARYFPFILNRGAWPYRADVNHFTDLPGRRPALLFAGRAYSRPEYVELWKTLPADPTEPVVQRTFPIRQPLLWVTRENR